VSTHRYDPFVLTNSIANPVLLPLLNSSAGAVLGRRLAVVRYDGRRTGQPHELVAIYNRVGATVRIRVGGAGRKQWWRNFTTPHPVTLRLAGQDHTVLAHVERNGGVVTVTADLPAPTQASSSARSPASTAPEGGRAVSPLVVPMATTRIDRSA
jgi:hypothetical protein